MSEVNMTFDNTTVSGTVIGIKQDTYNAVPAQNSDILQELQSVQRKLEGVEPMVADAVSDLRTAIERQDHPKISDTIRKLTSGFAASVITKVASESVLRYLGMK